jgi:hypothetical protein
MGVVVGHVAEPPLEEPPLEEPPLEEPPLEDPPLEEPPLEEPPLEEPPLEEPPLEEPPLEEPPLDEPPLDDELLEDDDPFFFPPVGSVVPASSSVMGSWTTVCVQPNAASVSVPVISVAPIKPRLFMVQTS